MFGGVGLPQVSLHKLQLAQNTAARLISRTPIHQHITPNTATDELAVYYKEMSHEIICNVFRSPA